MPDVLPLPDTTDLQLELGAPIPGEDEAWTAYNMLKDERAAGKPMAPDIRTKAVQTWTTYRDTAKRFNRQLFPKQVAPMLAQRKKWQDGLLSGLDQLPQHLTPEQNKALTTRLNIFPEAARPEEIARTANYALISATVGQKIKPEAWPAFRTAYAKNVLKITDTTDTGVYTELKRRNDVKLDADKNLSGDLEILYPQALAGAQIDMKAHGEQYRKLFPAEIAQAVEFELRTQLNTARAQGKRVRPIAEALLKFTLQESFRQELVTPPAPGDAPIPGTLGEAARRFEDLSEADKTATAIYLNQKLRNLPPDQASLAERFAEAMANTAIEGGRNALNFVNRAALDAAGGDTKDRDTWQQWLSSSGYLRGKAAKIREIVQPTDTWGKLSLLAAGEQLPYMIAAAGGPVGMALNGLGMAGQSYEQARQRNPEGNDLAQFTAAAASGFTQSALETQATKITGRAIGALPGLRSTFGAKFGTESFLKLAGIQNNLLRAATGGAITAGLVGVTEYGEEWAQESADRTLQDIASIATGVTDDTGAPSTMFKNLKTVTQSWDPRTEKGSKMLLALLPFIIIGGGGGGFASFKNGHILKENAAAMEALGVPAPVINEIVTTPDITKAESLLKQAFQVEQIEIDKGKATDLADWIDDKENALKQLGISLIVPEMNDFTEEEQYRVNFPNGPKYFNTLEESHTAIYEKTRELENTYIESGREAITTDTVNFLMEPGQRAAQGDFRVKENDFQGTIPELLKRGMVTKEQVLSRAEAMAYQLGITQSDALAQMNSGKVRISAQNFIEQVGKKANRYVINLFQGADPINAIEDFAEAFWKAGEFEGLFKPEQAIGWIRETEDSTGNSYLPKDFTWENGGENMAFWEALGQLSRQHALGNHDHINIPKGFKQWIEMMLMVMGQAWEWFKDLTQGKELQEAITNGMLNKKFVGMLADSIGLNEKMRDQRVIEEETANSRAEFMAEFPALTDRIKGKLLHPARAWQDGNPLAGELQKIYDELVVTHKKISKSGRRTWQKYNIAAENFFAPRTESVNMSDLFQTMQGEGFTFESIAEMLDAVEDAMFYGKESYATHGGLAANQIAAGYRQSFSLSVANDNGDTVSSVTIPKPFGMNDSNVVSIRADVATGDMPTRADTKRNSSFSISRQQEIYNEAEKKLQDAISLEETAKFSWLSNNNYRTDEIGKKLLDRFRQLNKEYTQPVPGVKFNYRGREAYVSDDGERIVYGPGKWDSDPINWLEVSYTKWLVYQEAVAELQNAEADLYIASIDYDPAREIAQKQFESEHQTLRLQFIDSRAAQFAAALDSAYGPTYTEKDAARLIWQTYAKNDDLFQYGKTTSKDAEDIATAVSIPRSPITATVQGSSIVYTSKEGSLTIHDANKKRPYIRSTEANSQGKEGGGGSQLYTAALDWIHNNEKKIKDDSGLSEINAIRRTSIFFASAIRWGTAKHLMPHANQGVAGWGKNDNTNISLLAIKEMENVHARAPKSKELTFDFKTGKVTAADESEYSRAEIRDIAISHDPKTSAIGTTTLLRGIITASALQELQSGTFATALGVSAPNTRPNSVRGVSYSLSRDTSTSLEALIEARMNRGPEERVRMLETMRTRLQAIVAKLEDRRDGLLSPMEKQLLGWRGTGDLTPEQRERLRIEDAMAGVKGVINALPVEIRSKVAIPITRILDADTDLKTTNAFRELIQNADNVIEEFLQESYTERIANILDTARPTSTESRQNKTLLTPDTQRQIDAIDEIIQMEEVQVIAAEAEAEAKIIALQDQIDAIDQADPDHDTKARALTRQQIEFVQRLDQIHTFGSLGKASSPELANAFEKLQRLYTTGRYARQSIDQAAREQLRASRQDIKEAVGRPDGVTGPEHSRATSKTWWGGLQESAKAYALEHLNFHEILETLFPNSITAQQWSKKAIAAMRGTKRRRLAASDRFNAFMADRFGATTTLQRGRLLDELSQKKDLPVRIREAGKPRMEKVPIEMVPRILNGQLPQSWSNDFIAMEQLRQQWRDYQLAPKKSRSRIQQLKIQFIETWKPADNLHLSQLEILDVLMTYAQEGYRPSLHKYGFNDTAIAELQAILDPRTKEIHAWLQQEYETGWAELNPVYQSLFNMDMPRIRNYAPGTFENFTNSSGQQTSGNPLGGEQGNATAMSAGFSKNRRAHLARPQAMNALSKFWAHHEQTSYWIEWAELVRDISNVLREPETRRAIEATHGKKLANDLAQWLDRLNTDGASAARERIETTALLERIISTNSALALSWNLGVPFKQFSAAFGSMVFVPANEAIRAFARLMTRPETFAHIWKQEAIQQRIKEGFSPEDRAAMDAEKIKPNHLTEMVAAGRLPISYTDAAFTTISAAIAYDYHYTAAIRAGMAPELAEREALQYMDMVTARTAQPADTQMRSLAELNARGAGKLLMMFKSDPRRAMGAVIAAAWKAQRSKSPADAMQFARVFTTQWALYGILAQLGGTIFKNLTTDSDDGDDPQPFIDWKAYAVAALLGPIEGLFVLGAIANALKKVLGVKVYTSSMNPLDDYIGRGINAMKKDDATAWEIASGQGVLNAVGMFGGAANRPEAALLPILARASRQALGAMDNLITTEEEQQKRIIRDTREAYTNDRDMRADGLDATVEKALALPLAERDALILTLDEKDRRKARAKIAEKEKQKSMTDPEKMLAKLPTGPREVAAAEIHKTITDPAARAQHAARMKELFDIEFQN